MPTVRYMLCRTFAVLLVSTAVVSWQPAPVFAQQLVIGRATVEQTASNTEGARAKISWFTTLPADGRVDYGTTTSYINYLASSLTDTYHEVTLTNLTSETTYHFKLTSVTSSGDRLESFDQTFKTLKFKRIYPPSITDVRTIYTGATYAVVAWHTDASTDSKVEYTTDATFKRTAGASGSGTTTHEVTIKGLKTGTTYYYRVHARDKDGNQAVGAPQTMSTSYDTVGDKAALAISQVSPVSYPDPLITGTAITFTWRTSRLAKGYVDLRGVKVASKRVNEPDGSVTEHQLTISGLKPSSRYVAKIYAKDVLGNAVTTGDVSLTTNPSAPPAPPPAGSVSGASCQGPYVYGVACRDLTAERSLAIELRTYLSSVFKGNTPAAALKNWYTLVKAYAYGGYPPEALVQAVKFGGKTVHPTIPWSEWQSSEDYRAYINRK